MFTQLLLVLFAYLLGSIPFGLFVAKGLCGVDPREAGSKNTGATNVARLCGTKFGLLAFLLDAAKGFVPTIWAASISTNPAFVSLVLFASIAGHVFSCFLKFKGGKAVATTIGAFLAVATFQVLIALFVLLAAVRVTGFISVGSILFAGTVPIALLFSKPALAPVACLVCALVVWRHRDNIARLKRGEEKPWRKKSDQKA